MVPHSSQRSTAGEEGLRVTSRQAGKLSSHSAPWDTPLVTLGGRDGWMLPPDWDYGGPSCSVKTSGVRVVWALLFFFLIVVYSLAAPGLCSSAFQLPII